MEDTPFSFLRFRPDPAVMRENDLPGDRQPKTRAPLPVVPRLRKGFEDRFQTSGLNAGARIPDTHTHATLLTSRLNDDVPFFTIFYGITHEIQEDLKDLIFIKFHRG